MRKEILLKLQNITGRDRCLLDEPMKEHTTFRIGGPADVFLVPKNADEIRELLLVCREYEVPHFILGNGSNLLVSDDGYRGAVILIDRNLSGIRVDGTSVKAQAGALMAKIASAACSASLTGFEFASGIPGTIGGGAAMNAGAYGSEMKNVVQSVRVLDEELQERVFSAEELDFGYRHSRISDRSWVVLDVTLSLQAGDRDAVAARMRELREKRTSKQPLEYPSAGSTFKRPEGFFAGKLIMDSGLSGYRVGGAKVSEKHCGFVVNDGGATAADVAAVIRGVQETVWQKQHVHLEPEVRFLGFDGTEKSAM